MQRTCYEASPDWLWGIRDVMGESGGGKCNQIENLEALWRGAIACNRLGISYPALSRGREHVLSLTAASILLHACKHN